MKIIQFYLKQNKSKTRNKSKKILKIQLSVVKKFKKQQLQSLFLYSGKYYL